MKEKDLELLGISPVDYLLASDRQREFWKRQVKELKKHDRMDTFLLVSSMIVLFYIFGVTFLLLSILMG